MKTYAPIALFVFDRPLKTKRVLESLARNQEFSSSPLFVFCDGPTKTSDQEQKLRIEQVRAIAQALSDSPQLTLQRRDANLGLAASIRQGVSQILESHDRVIVVEDDLEVSSHFLAHHNYYLDHYPPTSNVAAISSYLPERSLRRLLPGAFLARHFNCWGWSCWKSTWEQVNWDAESLYAELTSDPDVQKAFDLGGYADFSSHLEANLNGTKETWAVFMAASIFLSGRLCLFPNRSLVRNLGFDDSGENCTSSANQLYQVGEFPDTYPRRLPCRESLVGKWYLTLFYRFGQVSLVSAISSIIRGRVRALSGPRNATSPS